jgi:hypothetical protein
MKRSQFDANFFELPDPREISGALSPQAVGFEHAAGIPDAVLEAELQAR